MIETKRKLKQNFVSWPEAAITIACKFRPFTILVTNFFFFFAKLDSYLVFHNQFCVKLYCYII